MRPPAETERLRARVDAALRAYLDDSLPRVAGLHPTLEPLVEELGAFVLNGGKRLRPVLVLLGYQAAHGDDLDAVLGPALAMELLHTCALLHDDIIDDAPTRRGRTATHVAFATMHRDGGWNGDAADFGTAAAILLGDLAFVQADELFLQGRVSAERLLAGFAVFTELREEVMAGQYLDVLAATVGTTSREIAMTVASYKSGRYSVARPLQVGAVLAGADDALVTGLLRVGDPLGQAFQIRDDLLGVFGTEDETGKSARGDLAEGKRTLLVAEADARLEGAERDRFRSLLGRPDLTEDQAEELRTLMRACGALDATSATVDRLVAESIDQLEGLPVASEAGDVLRGLATFIGSRRS